MDGTTTYPHVLLCCCFPTLSCSDLLKNATKLTQQLFCLFSYNIAIVAETSWSSSVVRSNAVLFLCYVLYLSYKYDVMCDVINLTITLTIATIIHAANIKTYLLPQHTLADPPCGRSILDTLPMTTPFLATQPGAHPQSPRHLIVHFLGATPGSRSALSFPALSRRVRGCDDP